MITEYNAFKRPCCMSQRTGFNTTTVTGISLTFSLLLIGCGDGKTASAVPSSTSTTVDAAVLLPSIVAFSGYDETTGFQRDANQDVLVFSAFDNADSGCLVTVELNQKQYDAVLNDTGVSSVMIPSADVAALGVGQPYVLSLELKSIDGLSLYYGVQEFQYQDINASGLIATAEDNQSIALSESDTFTVKTSLGDFTIQLFESTATVNIDDTINNFKSYVSNDAYDGTVFHRVIDGFMVQGGGFDAEGDRQSILAPIALETGFENVVYTIAMARTSEPDSATNQFFINVADNAFLNATGLDTGYAVFGEVIAGFDVIDGIALVDTGVNTATGMQDWPLENIVIDDIVAVT